MFTVAFCCCVVHRHAFTHDSRVLRESAMVWASVCLSVCLSHCCIVSKRCKLGLPNFYCGCRQNSSFLWQNLMLLGEGVPLKRGVKERHPLKNAILPLFARLVWKWLQIGTYMLLIITSTGHGLFSFINADDLEQLWTPKSGVLAIFCSFWLQRTFQEWIAAKWLEIDQNNLRMNFLLSKVDVSSLSPDPIGSKRLAHASVKEGYPSKTGYFTNILSTNVKTVADKHHRHTL